jgi:enamine deaminase RidA (YjgF/YER057c/UK114 family)
MSPSRRKQWALALIFIAPALWSVNYLVGRTAAATVAPHFLALGRWVFAGLLLLAGKPIGLNYGYGIIATSAAAVASENKTLAFPSVADTIPTKSSQEDHVSMAPWSCRKARQVLDNVAHALAGGGSSIENLVQVRVYVTDIASWPEFNTIYAQWAGAARPARAVVPVPHLHYGFKIEVEAVALA